MEVVVYTSCTLCSPGFECDFDADLRVESLRVVRTSHTHTSVCVTCDRYEGVVVINNK